MYNELFKNKNAVVITNPSNLFYFSQYQNDDAAIILTTDKKYYISDSRVLEEVKELLKDFEIVEVVQNNYIETIGRLIEEMNCKTVGYEDLTIKLSEYNKLATINGELISSSAEINAIRAKKSVSEIELITKAQEITEQSLEEIFSYFKEGITEIEIKQLLESIMLKNGSDNIAFSSIVAFGENTAKPHAHASKRKLKFGDAVTLDFGAKYKGYCADMTRSFLFGKSNSRYKEIYNHVLESQKYAIDKLKAGIIGKDGDALARNYLKKYGLDKYFTHSLGHSLGVDIHESPNLSPRCEAIIEENYVLSVEPGVYFAGEFGIRIEDIVNFQKSSVVNLTKCQKNLIII